MLPGTAISCASCISASSCTAVGNVLAPWGWSYAYTARWDGSKWALSGIPQNLRIELSGVSCISSQVCTAVGHYTDEENQNATTRVYHWDEDGWVMESSPNPEGSGSRLGRRRLCPSPSLADRRLQDKSRIEAIRCGTASTL